MPDQRPEASLAWRRGNPAEWHLNHGKSLGHFTFDLCARFLKVAEVFGVSFFKARFRAIRSVGDAVKDGWHLLCPQLLVLSGVPFFNPQFYGSAIEAQPLGGCQVTSGLVINSLAIPAEQLRR